MINRIYLERLMYFKKEVEIHIDSLEEDKRIARSTYYGSSVERARLSEANSTLAYLDELLDAYWLLHNKEETEQKND